MKCKKIAVLIRRLHIAPDRIISSCTIGNPKSRREKRRKQEKNSEKTAVAQLEELGFIEKRNQSSKPRRHSLLATS